MARHLFHSPETLAVSALSWTAMMALMMAPTVAPWLMASYRFGSSTGGWGNRWLSATAFAGGYLAVWMLFGVVVAFAQRVVQIPANWTGVVLVGAGLFQFTALKRACLTHCRNPFSFLLARWKNGPRSATALGVSHGIYCLGCCWALMVTSLAVGFMSLWWMTAIAVVTFVEQATVTGARLRIPIGLALIGVGLSL
jgi:predicted metal-binding membrane protein